MYIFLSFLYLIVAYLFGRKASSAKSALQYWKCLVIPITVFSILYGCRYGWMIDFTYYEYEYKALATNADQGKMGWLLYYLFRIGAVADVPYNAIITLLNFSLIVSLCWITYFYRRYAQWILPLFYFVSRMTANFIAFYPAIGAMCLFMVLFLQAENKFNLFNIKEGGLWLPLLILIVAFGYHPASIVAILIYVIVIFIRVKPLYAIIAYALSFAFQTEAWLDVMNILSGYLNLYSSSNVLEAYSSYAENADSFYATHAFEGRTAPIFFYARNFLANSFAIYLYYKYSIENQIDIKRTKILELSTVALIVSNMTEGVELFQRYGMMFRTFLPLLYSISIVYGLNSNVRNYKLMAYTIILIIGQYYVSDAFLNLDDGYNRLYIWDL